MSQPHDGLIKYAFSRREHAVGLVKAVLEPEVAALVQWSTLRLEKDSFMDKALRGRYVDLLLSARMGDGRLYLYTVVEQQRAIEKLMIFRLNVYMTRFWERLVRDRPNLVMLPPIVPMLIHHSATGWTAATAFEDIVEVPEPARAALSPHIPHFKVRLVDLSAGRVSGLVEEALTAFGKFVLWALSVAGDDARFAEEIGRMQAALQEALSAADWYDAGCALLRYLVATHERLGRRKVVEMLNTAAGKEQGRIMDVLDEFRNEVRALMLLDQLAARFGRVPTAAKARVLSADEAVLARWSLRVLTEPTLDAVLDGSAMDAKAAKKTAPARRTMRASRA